MGPIHPTLGEFENATLLLRLEILLSQVLILDSTSVVILQTVILMGTIFARLLCRNGADTLTSVLAPG